MGRKGRKQKGGKRPDRYYKRIAKRLNEEKNKVFIKIAEEWVGDMLAINMDFDSEKAGELFDKYQAKWKNYARSFITKHSNDLDYGSTEKRMKLIEHFDIFVKKYSGDVEEKKSETPPAKAESKVSDGFVCIESIQYRIEDVISTFKELGIKTTAKTSNGLLKVFYNQSVDAQIEVLKKLETI